MNEYVVNRRFYLPSANSAY